jgi:predicted acylesterase/phospholipase RssA
MSMNPLRKYVGIAFDGGGIKGLIVARALVALEEELQQSALIKCPQIKILAGTSTGAILAASIAVGMSAGDIAKSYKDMGQKVFPPLTPVWFPDPLKSADEFLRSILQHSLYSNTQLIEALRAAIEKQTGKPDLTLAELNEMLKPGKALILTTVNIADRRTRFLKSYSENDGNWKLWEAILASASVPPALPIWPRIENGKYVYYTDGGVGSYVNPSYIVAREAIHFHGYPARNVSILSFGTGWVSGDNYLKENGIPSNWHGLDWARNAPNLFCGDATRSQSLDVLQGFETCGIDFRRFQFELEKDIPADAFADDPTYAFMERLGDGVGRCIRENHFAPNPSAQYDPEGLFVYREKYLEARKFCRRQLKGRKFLFRRRPA